MLIIHQEAKGGSSHPTAETVKCLSLRTDGKRRRLFLMKWTERLEIGARPFERKIRTDHLDNVIRGRDLLDCL